MGKVKSARSMTIPKANRKFYFNKEKELEMGPSPSSYRVRTEDESWKVKHKGLTIGRDSRVEGKMVLPGPSDYDKPALSRKSFNRSFTFYRTTRELNSFLKEKGRDSPGPKYEAGRDSLSVKTGQIR